MLLIAVLATLIGSPQQTQALEGAKPEKKICRYDVETGSIMPGKRVCRSAKDWGRRDGKNGADADRFRARSLTAGMRLEPGFD